MAESNSEKLIRLKNLRLLGLTSQQLSESVGGRDTYWRDMLKGDKSFGEKVARKIEDRLEIPRTWLDTPQTTRPSRAREPVVSYAGPSMPFGDLNAFEAQLVTLFRQLNDRPNLQHQVLIAMNKMVSGDGSGPTVADPFALKTPTKRRGISVFGDIEDAPAPKKRVR